MTEEGNPSKERLKAIERARELCRKCLESIREIWNSTRHEKTGQMISLEHKVSQPKEQIRETEVRFTIGYYDKRSFEARINDLKANLQRIEREISKLRDYVNEMNRKVFRCSELPRKTCKTKTHLFINPFNYHFISFNSLIFSFFYFFVVQS